MHSSLSEEDARTSHTARSPSPSGEGRGEGLSHTGSINLALVLLFLIPRLALLFAREPFFDELFTRWMSAGSFTGILSALHSDSGPPLYYFIIHLLGHPESEGSALSIPVNEQIGRAPV